MIDYDYCEQMAMAEAMPIIAKAVENVPQKAEAREFITYCISVGVRLMKAQVFAQEMLDDGEGEINFEGGSYYVERFATEEEKAKLFDAIKENGYRWNAETKTLEKLIKPIFKAENLQPYKKEPMYLNRKVNEQTEEIKKILEPMKEMMEERKLDIPNGYEFFGIDDDNKIVLTKKQSQYPKTYEECCKIMGAKSDRHYCYTKKDKYEDYPYEVKLLDSLDYLRQLLICRDAYWKIAGEQMGLGKPWEPDWAKADERKYCIANTGGNITKWVQKTTNKILAFPTEEMREAFFENFKEWIELAKELL